MPTSTNMQSSTHLPLLVVVVVMAERIEPLPHPSSPPTEDVMQTREKKKREIKATWRLVWDFVKKKKKKRKNTHLTCLDRMTFFRSGSPSLWGSNMFLLLLLHDSSQFRWKVQWLRTISWILQKVQYRSSFCKLCLLYIYCRTWLHLDFCFTLKKRSEILVLLTKNLNRKKWLN